MKKDRKIIGYFLFKARSIPGPGEPGMAEDEREFTHRTQHTRPLSSLAQGTVHRKKKVREFSVPSRDVTTKLSLGGAGIMTS
jgi:hypothetical protein